MPGFIGLPELVLLGLVVLLVFGPKRLPEMGRSMGRGLREFKESVTGDQSDMLDPLLVPVEDADTEVVTVVPSGETSQRLEQALSDVTVDRKSRRVA
jgi:sec-independent protein translocase protein TatA